ncbi:hypothetical protein LYSIN_01026 [Lysinibacillus sphaericus]|uniref:Peptidase C39-like domain-containing protein n=1 Tax=Lysinibacillus sphaericus TaxID=1421 RepID=A0A2S5CZJ4_LYSSH|nr:C39 family peptidase [Lysinibacillus sphaericus]POZ56243.1 hypothetical protein LYSIN_01026 [Lysinibacillus sphaericus]
MFKSAISFMFGVIALIIFSTFSVSTSSAQEIESSSFEEIQSETSQESIDALNDYLINGYSLDASDYNIVVEKDVYDLDEIKIAKYYSIKSFSGQEYFAIISNINGVFTTLLGGEGAPDELVLGKGKYYYPGGFTLISADDANQILDYIKSKNETLSINEIKRDLKIQLEDSSLIDPLSSSYGSKLLSSSYGSKLLSSPIFSQHDSDVKKIYRNSACGPTTIAVILQYWHDSNSKTKLQVYNAGYTTKGAFINSMYANRGGSAFGMSVSGVRSGLENEVIARGYAAVTSSFNNFSSYKTEIDNSRPVAVKFDKYFTLFEPNVDYDYDYHWTPGLGYIYSSSGSLLRVQTLGTNSYVRDINYATNSAIISMVSLTIK